MLNVKNKIRCCSFVLLLSMMLASAASDASVDTRDLLSDHEMKNLVGETTTLKSMRGEVVVVNFWASWCAPCREELPLMDNWNAAWEGRGARVVAISVDSDVRKARRFADKAELKMTLLHDGPSLLARQLDLPALPCTYFLDREGNIVAVFKGSSPKDLAVLKQQVETLVASSAVENARAIAGGTK